MEKEGRKSLKTGVEGAAFFPGFKKNVFFFRKDLEKIEITENTKIKMGSCYPSLGGRPVNIWKISNHHGKEKIKIHSDFFDYKYVNSIFEKLNGKQIEFSTALIKF